MDRKTCKDCFFFATDNAPEDEETREAREAGELRDIGECHLKAPSTTESEDGRPWPSVYSDDFCGKLELAPDDEDKVSCCIPEPDPEHVAEMEAQREKRRQDSVELLRSFAAVVLSAGYAGSTVERPHHLIANDAAALATRLIPDDLNLSRFFYI